MEHKAKGKKQKQGRWKVPLLKIWIVTEKELARADSKIAILEARYKSQLVREQIAARNDKEVLKQTVYKSLEKAVAGLQRENFYLRKQIEKMKSPRGD